MPAPRALSSAPLRGALRRRAVAQPCGCGRRERWVAEEVTEEEPEQEEEEAKQAERG